ncbi:actin-binding ADF family protein [Streptomyces sp. NPDC101206]|uniref:actin-binding ADF family protein n=1 Tax=Streptomyces sp. NPDC101206 TaxID=3366128 RepID=UPI00382F9DE3
MSDAIRVTDECVQAFTELKFGKKHKYVIYAVSADRKEITVETTSTDTTYDTFVSALPENACRYAVYDFEYKKENEGTRNKIVFFFWSPDTSEVREKMVYAKSKNAIRDALNGVAVEIQGTDASEVSYQAVYDRANRA